MAESSDPLSPGSAAQGAGAQGAGAQGSPAARIAITYCTQCNWLLRAAWMAQELLQTFASEIGEVALRPGTGGVFTIVLGEHQLWDRRSDGGFPDIKLLKQRVRDQLAPGRDLGHTDRIRDGSLPPIPTPGTPAA